MRTDCTESLTVFCDHFLYWTISPLKAHHVSVSPPFVPGNYHSAWPIEGTQQMFVNPHSSLPPSMGKSSASSILRKRLDRPWSLGLIVSHPRRDSVPSAAPPPPPFTYFQPFSMWHVMHSGLLIYITLIFYSTQCRERVGNETHRVITGGPHWQSGQGGHPPCKPVENHDIPEEDFLHLNSGWS